MEGSREAMQQEGEASSHEKVKRKLKTPAQVEALENFFNEHKYPSEAMKLEFAKKIGLSEKQVSGWFCHRRLKEKKTILQGEISTNGKQNLSSSAIHDGISGVKQESCSSTKQLDRNLDSKEVESRMTHRDKSSSGVLAHEFHDRLVHVGNNRAIEDQSLSSSSASQGSYIQINENLCVEQSSKYNFWDDSSMLMSNKNSLLKSKEHMVNARHSLRDENDAQAISALKWKLGRLYREDGPLIGFEFDPLPPGAFDSPVRDSNCEPYYVGESTQHKSSSLYRNINEPRVYDKYNIEKLSSKTYQEQRSFQRTKPKFIDSNEIIKSLQSTKSAFSNNAQYQATAMDETETSINQTSGFDGRNNLRCFKVKSEVGYDRKDGYDSYKKCRNSNINISFPHHSYDAQVLQGEYLDTKPFITVPKKYDSKLLKDNIRQGSAKRNYSVFQPELVIKGRNNTAGKVNGEELWQQQCAAGEGIEKHVGQVPFIRHPWNAKSNHHQDDSGETSSFLD